MILNDKYFVYPPQNESDLKELIKLLTSSGAGRPVDKDGFALGPWTPELLADAITQIDRSGLGIELRTAQLWFQDNEKGISADNIRWLARIFGCDDPKATNEWQVELNAARQRLNAKRRQKHRVNESESNQTVEPRFEIEQKRGSSLANFSESLFSRSILNLPTSVFALAVALCYTSYFLDIHNILYELPKGLIKQVGYLWAPNWTIVFMAFFPISFGVVTELLVYWKTEGRLMFVNQSDQNDSSNDWQRNVEATAYTYWAVLVICIFFVGIFQWYSIRLLPLLQSNENFSIDWGRIAIIHPDLISVPESIGFTALAYTMLVICFYLFYAGLILLFTICNDVSKIHSFAEKNPEKNHQHKFNLLSVRVMKAIFRFTILGILIAMCMKLQSAYMASSGWNILIWLGNDMNSIVAGNDEKLIVHDYISPNHFSSLLVVLSACFVFIYGIFQLGYENSMLRHWSKMLVAIAFLVLAYMMIGAFMGFSILLSFAVLIGIYGFFDPWFGNNPANGYRDKPDVL